MIGFIRILIGCLLVGFLLKKVNICELSTIYCVLAIIIIHILSKFIGSGTGRMLHKKGELMYEHTTIMSTLVVYWVIIAIIFYINNNEITNLYLLISVSFIFSFWNFLRLHVTRVKISQEYMKKRV